MIYVVIGRHDQWPKDEWVILSHCISGPRVFSSEADALAAGKQSAYSEFKLLPVGDSTLHFLSNGFDVKQNCVAWTPK